MKQGVPHSWKKGSPVAEIHVSNRLADSQVTLEKHPVSCVCISVFTPASLTVEHTGSSLNPGTCEIFQVLGTKTY